MDQIDQASGLAASSETGRDRISYLDGGGSCPLACRVSRARPSLSKGDLTMVSVDHYRQELRSQMDRAATHGAIDILINAGELCRTLRGGITATDACCKAMREELKLGDIVLIEPGAGVGTTIRYRLPRPGR